MVSQISIASLVSNPFEPYFLISELCAALPPPASLPNKCGNQPEECQSFPSVQPVGLIGCICKFEHSMLYFFSI